MCGCFLTNSFNNIWICYRLMSRYFRMFDENMCHCTFSRRFYTIHFFICVFLYKLYDILSLFQIFTTTFRLDNTIFSSTMDTHSTITDLPRTPFQNSVLKRDSLRVYSVNCIFIHFRLSRRVYFTHVEWHTFNWWSFILRVDFVLEFVSTDKGPEWRNVNVHAPGNKSEV